MGAMRSAVRMLAEHRGISLNLKADVASLYETQAVGGPPDQPPYLNSALRLTTSLTPDDLLRAALAVETSLGRSRRVRWESRVIDIDLLLFDDLVSDEPGLTLPHPRLHLRRFVLEPLSEIAGDVIHPRLNESISALAAKRRREHGNETAERWREPSWVLD